MDHTKTGNKMPESGPVSIGRWSHHLLAECIRKWVAGASLTEHERLIVDEALACNRLQMIQTVFAEVIDAER